MNAIETTLDAIERMIAFLLLQLTLDTEAKHDFLLRLDRIVRKFGVNENVPNLNTLEPAVKQSRPRTKKAKN